MATVNNINTVIENVKPTYVVGGIRRPIVFLSVIGPFLIWVLWELLSR